MSEFKMTRLPDKQVGRFRYTCFQCPRCGQEILTLENEIPTRCNLCMGRGDAVEVCNHHDWDTKADGDLVCLRCGLLQEKGT